jgi:uncharacterized protein YyaL (SSP411 family)
VNRLAQETSPYLRQHADNPVEWYPWGTDAFALAEETDRPLFISIGYASCHWCHVMAHESFEDPEIAAFLASSFVAVKVDREERPDIDGIYMAATQTMTGSGGWPMTVFCTPDGRPFFAGTYYPPEDRHGLPSFRRVLGALAEAWRDRRADVERQADELSAAVTQQVQLVDHLAPGPPDDALDYGQLLGAISAELAQGFDPEWGGFGPAPKFPRPSLVELCLLAHRRTGDEGAHQMALTTLDAMAAGGMYDHLEGGFCRYATDRTWLVPHFEKMLTDQALLARAYLHAYQVTANPNYLQVVTETLEYVWRGLATPQGALYSSTDADAGGHEGSHATFTPAQVRAALGEDDTLADAVCAWYDITDAGNWEGVSIPRRPLRAPLARPESIERARAVLAEVRQARPQPALDDKVLTEWNAMMAATLAEAAAVCERPEWGERAAGIMDFLFAQLCRTDGRWLRSFQGGRARHLALCADYAWVIEGCTRLAELTGERRWLERAGMVADQMIELFADEERGGFFTTGRDGEALLVRGKDYLDGALPSTNAIAALALARLGALSAQDRYRSAAQGVLNLGGSLLGKHPSALADTIAALGVLQEGSEIVITGDRPDLLAVVRARWLPTAVLAHGEPDDNALWQGRSEDRAYVCAGFTCKTPALDPDTLAHQLDGTSQGG